MANWLSTRPALHGELYDVRRLLWAEQAKVSELEERNSSLSNELQTMGLLVDEIGERLDKEMKDD